MTKPQPKRHDTTDRALAEAFAEEERSGMWIATIGRALAVLVIAILTASFQESFNEALYIWGLLALFIIAGFAHYEVVRRRLPIAWRYGFVALDFVLLAVSIFVPNPFEADIEPRQMLQRTGVFVYFLFIVSAYAFSYMPNLMRAAGAMAAITWCLGIGWLLIQPETVTAERLELDPYYVDTDLLTQTVVMILLISATLSVVVKRSRRLVERQVLASRQRTNLARHFSPRMVERLANRDDVLGASRVQSVAVLFADIVGFTRIADTMESDQVIALLRHFGGLMEEAVFDHGGTLDKFLGDGVMATFGTPDPGPEDASNALASGIAMQHAVGEWNRGRTAAGEPAITISVGIHYGEVVIGDVGSERRLELAVLGDVVNVASRLEAATRRIDAALLVSEVLASRCRTEDTPHGRRILAALEPTAPLELPGKPDPVSARMLRRGADLPNDPFGV